MARLFILTVFLALSFFHLQAQVYSVNETDSARGIKFNLVAFLGVLYGTESREFGDVKQELLDGKDPFFRNSPALSLSLKYRFTRSFRMALNADLTYSHYNEAIEQRGSADVIVRNLYEDINVTTLYLVPSLEIIPYATQFKSYFSIGAGLARSTVKWEEKVYKTFGADKRNSGPVYNKSVFHPAFRLAAGLELGFDKNTDSKFLGGLIMEMRYSHIFRIDNYFGTIPDDLDLASTAYDDISLLNSALTLNLGLSFNFYR